jgi:Nuclease-related domain
MAGKHHEGDRACHCHPADASCAGLAVRRLSRERVRELAEEIWTASTGSVLPARPATDPRGSRAGASAQAAYRRRRRQELEAWRPGLRWRAWTVFGAAVGGLLVGLALGLPLGWPMALAPALLTGWRLRFRPSASARVWRRQAALQRRTAGMLPPLEQEGYLLLHDLTLPGWPAGLDHVVVGPTGVWVIASWQRRLPALPRRATRAHGAASSLLRELRWQSAAIADALAGDGSIPVRPLLCVHGGRGPGSPRSVEGVPVAPPRRLADVIRRGSPLQPGEVDQATTRVLEVLRPAV